jgi:hypothetical protein
MDDDSTENLRVVFGVLPCFGIQVLELQFFPSKVIPETAKRGAIVLVSLLVIKLVYRRVSNRQ